MGGVGEAVRTIRVRMLLRFGMFGLREAFRYLSSEFHQAGVGDSQQRLHPALGQQILLPIGRFVIFILLPSSQEEFNKAEEEENEEQKDGDDDEGDFSCSQEAFRFRTKPDGSVVASDFIVDEALHFGL